MNSYRFDLTVFFEAIFTSEKYKQLKQKLIIVGTKCSIGFIKG